MKILIFGMIFLMAFVSVVEAEDSDSILFIFGQSFESVQKEMGTNPLLVQSVELTTGPELMVMYALTRNMIITFFFRNDKLVSFAITVKPKKSNELPL